MNIILIGTNGAGKTTIANKLYKDGYHLFRLSPLSEKHGHIVNLCLQDHNLVFDRWNVLDQDIYRNKDVYLKYIIDMADVVNKNNIIIYLRNYDDLYNDEHNSARIVQRPTLEKAKDIDLLYMNYAKVLSNHGIKIYCVDISKQLTVDQNYELIQKIIREHNYEK